MKPIKNTNKPLWITFGILVGIILLGLIIQSKVAKIHNDQTISNRTSSLQSIAEKPISYKGKNGTDALSLLKASHTVLQDKSNLVIQIDARRAEAQKREYWAFYVNGKLSPVGPLEYTTQNSDKIEWKIDTY
jgi:hypothetical protein